MALDGPLTSMVVQVIQSTTAALVGQVRYRGPQGPEFDAQGCSYSETAQKCSAVPRHGRVGRGEGPAACCPGEDDGAVRDAAARCIRARRRRPPGQAPGLRSVAHASRLTPALRAHGISATRLHRTTVPAANRAAPSAPEPWTVPPHR